MTSSPRQSTRRALRLAPFCAYAAALFLLTHWPNLRVAGPVHRPDIIAHLTAFALWTLLLLLSRLLGDPARLATYARVLPVAMAYAAIDEALQAIPFVQRIAAWDDFLANAAGVVLGALTGFALARFVGAPARTGHVPRPESRPTIDTPQSSAEIGGTTPEGLETSTRR